ncbi:MAG: efflux RND transporter periplasmic adaptor subunit [Terriglobia bacterium]|jgi:multidrug resistance efflux pump|nr:efflux RND transporter periplasmic adaptor subunit [Terriglobia bacterium]
MKSRFFIFMGLLVAGAVIYYFLSTNRSSDLVLIGTVDANQVIVSSKIMGRIEKLTVQEGSPVKAGELVATIDKGELMAQKNAAEATLASLRSQVSGSRYNEKQAAGETENNLANARATLSAAKASLAEAQASLEQQRLNTQRTVALAQQGVASQQDKDNAETALQAAQARVQAGKDQVTAAAAAVKVSEARLNQAQAATATVASTRQQMENAQAQLADAEVRLGYTNIYAPVTGTVSLWAARQGEVVNPGTPIITIVDLNDTWVYASIPEQYSDKVQLGDTLTVQLPSGERVNGKVIAKAAEADFATQRDVSRTKRDIRTIRLKLQIDNPGQKFTPGMTAEVLIPKSKLEPK